MSGSEPERLDDAMAAIRAAVERQSGTERPSSPDVDAESLVRFSADLAARLDEDERRSLAQRAEELQPWLQGPFLLGGDLVVGGLWRNDQRWVALGAQLDADLSGRRVLDVGCNAGYDPFMFRLRGAEYVLGCEPYEFIRQARFLESIYQSGADFQQIGWQELDPASHGRFDLVHCHGVLYHELDPMGLLRRLAEMTERGGTLLLGSMMLGDRRLAEHVRFVPTEYYGDGTWWWVPGQLALRWMIQASGFDVVGEFGESPGPPGEFSTINGYFQATRADRAEAS